MLPGWGGAGTETGRVRWRCWRPPSAASSPVPWINAAERREESKLGDCSLLLACANPNSSLVVSASVWSKSLLPGSLVWVHKEYWAGWQQGPPRPQTSEQHQPFGKDYNNILNPPNFDLLTVTSVITSHFHLSDSVTHHIPKDGILQSGVANNKGEGVGAGHGVELRLALRCVQFKLVQVLVVRFCHEHNLLASFLIVQPDKSLTQRTQRLKKNCLEAQCFLQQWGVLWIFCE